MMGRHCKHDWSVAAAMAADGRACSELARAMSVTCAHVSQWAKKNGVVFASQLRRGPRPSGQSDRNHRMAEMYRQGLTLAKIGQQFGVTRERVRQIVQKLGCARSGMNLRTVANEQKRHAKRIAAEARVMAKWGVGMDLWRESRANGTILAFTNQKNSAKNRAIAWRLTFGQWYAIWQASGKFHLRGRGKGKYCMSRIKDDGPYALGNVHVQLAQQNSREATEKWIGKTKAIQGVFCLYPGRELAWLAKVGKRSLGYFRTAEEAGVARDAYIAENGCPTGRGKGRGWTFVANCPGRPYLVQFCGKKLGSYTTQAEAESVYAAAAAAIPQAA